MLNFNEWMKNDVTWHYGTLSSRATYGSYLLLDIWQKLKQKKTQNVSKITTNKQIGYLVLEVGIVVVTINK
jgi:hypothetical protein